jgi:hypothetical protein
MAHRPYFLLGDLAASTVTGAVVALATTAVLLEAGDRIERTASQLPYLSGFSE